MYCKSCKKETPQFTDKKGNMRCYYCNTITVPVKKTLEFVADEEFENELNPVKDVPKVDIDPIEPEAL